MTVLSPIEEKDSRIDGAKEVRGPEIAV